MAVRLLESTKKLRQLKSKNNPFYNLDSFLAKTNSSRSLYMIPKPKGGIVSKRKTKGDMRAWPRRRRFPAIGSAGWTAQIVRFPIILQKSFRTSKKSNPRFDLLSWEILWKIPELFLKSTCSPTVQVSGNLRRKP